MTSDFGAAMRQALELTRSRKLIDATHVIQRALSGRGPAEPAEPGPLVSAPLLEPPAPSTTAHGDSLPTDERMAAGGRAAWKDQPAARIRKPLGEVLRLLREADRSGLMPKFAPGRKAPVVPVAEGAAYLNRSYACAAGARDYTVYAPKGARGRKQPLVVMLHGCTQSPDDFAVGTRMNRLADELGFVVAYPGQAASANPSVCWNWFNPKDQTRDAGEPSIIAGITRAVADEFGVDDEGVYVAGLSAGGAMAAIMSDLYPDLYSAAGIHSGLPSGSADDLPSAFAAMRGGPGAAPAKRRRVKGAKGRVRTIVFHGANDKTVDPSNSRAILADALAGVAGAVHEARQDGIAGGQAYTRAIVSDARGVPHAELWEIDGLGHAWSGGSPDGSFTHSCGPDASREMLRFFLGGTAR